MRQKEKEEKRENKKKKQEQQQKIYNTLSEEEKLKLRELSFQKKLAIIKENEDLKKRLEEGYNSGLRIVFDCSFDYVMSQKQVGSVCNQLQYSYAFNKSLQNTLQIHITSLGDARVGKVFNERQGWDQWKIYRHQNHFIDIFTKSEIVYLTPESDCVLRELSKDEVYIIGAFVDRNQHKGITHQKCQELGLRTARLPLEEHIKLEASKVLTINHVFEILGKVYNGQSWKDAVTSSVPMRKGVYQGDDNNNNNNNDDNSNTHEDDNSNDNEDTNSNEK
eukprot:c14677_g1_i1.p1 GENE.c14677_g1_i1~~c14677_g1_i1.p1  ORF type:complete len:317 (+),score=121.98 c14677_g1_i1:121-951(+)